jgi:hypothetical protein
MSITCAKWAVGYRDYPEPSAKTLGRREKYHGLVRDMKTMGTSIQRITRISRMKNVLDKNYRKPKCNDER